MRVEDRFSVYFYVIYGKLHCLDLNLQQLGFFAGCSEGREVVKVGTEGEGGEVAVLHRMVGRKPGQAKRQQSFFL